MASLSSFKYAWMKESMPDSTRAQCIISNAAHIEEYFGLHNEAESWARVFEYLGLFENEVLSANDQKILTDIRNKAYHNLISLFDGIPSFPIELDTSIPPHIYSALEDILLYIDTQHNKIPVIPKEKHKTWCNNTCGGKCIE